MLNSTPVSAASLISTTPETLLAHNHPLNWVIIHWETSWSRWRNRGESQPCPLSCFSPLNCPLCMLADVHTHKHIHARTHNHTSAMCKGACGRGVGLSIRGFWRVVRVIVARGHGLPVCGCLLIRCGGGVASRSVSSRWIICSRCPVASRCVIARWGVVASRRGIIAPGWSIVAPRWGVITSRSVVRSWCCIGIRCGICRECCICPWWCRGCGGSRCLCGCRWRRRWWWRIGVGILEVLVLLLVLLILLVLMHLLVVFCIWPWVKIRVEEKVRNKQEKKGTQISIIWPCYIIINWFKLNFLLSLSAL